MEGCRDGEGGGGRGGGVGCGEGHLEGTERSRGLEGGGVGRRSFRSGVLRRTNPDEGRRIGEDRQLDWYELVNYVHKGSVDAKVAGFIRGRLRGRLRDLDHKAFDGDRAWFGGGWGSGDETSHFTQGRRGGRLEKSKRIDKEACVLCLLGLCGNISAVPLTLQPSLLPSVSQYPSRFPNNELAPPAVR